MRWTEKINKKYMQISLYVIITAVIIYSLSLVAKNAPFLAGRFMIGFRGFLRVMRPIILGFVFAYLLEPIVVFFERKIEKSKLTKVIKKPRTAASIFSIVILFVAVAGLISLLVFSVTNQIRLANFDDVVKLSEEFLNSVRAFYQSVLDKMNDLDIQSKELEEYAKKATEAMMGFLVAFAEKFVNIFTNISSYLTTIIFGMIIGFYFLIDGKMIRDYIGKIGRALCSKKHLERISGALSDIDRVFSGYIRGQLTDAFVMMILISLVLSITGVKFAIVIGIFTGIGNLIPYFGPIVAYVSTAVICLVNGEMGVLAVSMVALVIIQFIDGNFIGPRLLSHSIQIHPLIVIISLIFGNAIGGFLGMLFAVPVGAYIKLVFVRFVDRRLELKEKQEKTEKKSKISARREIEK